MKKKWLTLGCFLIVVLLGIWAYNVWFGTTKIAFVNFQTITMGGIAKANDNSFIKRFPWRNWIGCPVLIWYL